MIESRSLEDAKGDTLAPLIGAGRLERPPREVRFELREILLSQARSREWDVIVVGTSFAAMFFGAGLSPDLDVLFVEKGRHRSHEDNLRLDWDTVREPLVHRNTSGTAKVWPAFTLFGGNSNFWWGDTPRFHPDDFVLRSKFGVAEDWPFGYHDVEPHVARAEQLIEVAGGGSDHILPRSTPFPLPPHSLSRSDQALAAHDPLWVPLPTARANGGSRGQCCGNGVCRNCPVDAKFTILNGFERLAHPRARFLLGTEARSVDIRAGRAEALRVRAVNGDAAVLRGRTIALGANAIFNAAILLRSGVTSPALGRYLHEEASARVILDTATIRGGFGGTADTLHGYQFYHGVDRSGRAAVLMECLNAPFHIRPERGKWTHRIIVTLIAEDLPQPQNRVILENGEPVVEWTGHDGYAARGLAHAIERLPRLIPDQLDRVNVPDILNSQAHIQGTHRISPSAAEGVVDDRLRLHEAPNVFALGAGAFPTCSPANPSLMISALSLRAAEVVA